MFLEDYLLPGIFGRDLGLFEVTVWVFSIFSAGITGLYTFKGYLVTVFHTKLWNWRQFIMDRSTCRVTCLYCDISFPSFQHKERHEASHLQYVDLLPTEGKELNFQ